MQPRTFKNFQVVDAIRTSKGEVFEIKERLTYYCKGCNCKPLSPCETFTTNSEVTIQSQRGRWVMSLKEINNKYINAEIDEVTYVRGQWK